MLDEEEKNAAPSDKKKRMWVHKVFQKQKIRKDHMEETAKDFCTFRTWDIF